MVDFWKAIETFDPHTADPHFCWALLQMEAECYITIKHGTIIPTGKVFEISPQAILDRPAEVWECNAAKEMLTMEAEGLVSICNGVVTLTDQGKDEAVDALLAEKGYPKPSEGEVEIELSDEVLAYLDANRKPGETYSDVILRLFDTSEE
jgi:hypothetical protein